MIATGTEPSSAGVGADNQGVPRVAPGRILRCEPYSSTGTGGEPAMASELHGVEARMDAENLYREEIFTDRRVGTIRFLTPVTKEGLVDPSRKALYVGETQVL